MGWTMPFEVLYHFPFLPGPWKPYSRLKNLKEISHLTLEASLSVSVCPGDLDLVLENAVSRGLNSNGYMSPCTCMGHTSKHSWYPAFFLRIFVPGAD